jgi:predicted Mrr-cat superfamily restriction endonuclease
MTVWVLRQDLSESEEASILERKNLVLPFEGLPDLTHVENQAQAKKLLAVLYPGEPPESLNNRLHKFWHRFTTLQIEDLLVVPLVHAREIVIAEVTGHYHYMVGEHGSDVHLIPVRWYDKRIPLRKLAKHKSLFSDGNPAMLEIEDAEARTAIRDHLPHSYNRFAKWKWLLMFFFALSMLRMVIRSDN